MAMWCIFSVNQHIQYSFNFNVWKMSTFSFSPVIVNNLKIIWTLRHSFASTRNNAENLVEISKSKSVYESKYGIQHFYNSIKMICFIQINNLSVLYSYSFHVNLNSYAYACVCVGHVHGFYQPILNIWCISFFFVMRCCRSLCDWSNVLWASYWKRVRTYVCTCTCTHTVA